MQRQDCFSFYSICFRFPALFLPPSLSLSNLSLYTYIHACMHAACIHDQWSFIFILLNKPPSDHLDVPKQNRANMAMFLRPPDSIFLKGAVALIICFGDILSNILIIRELGIPFLTNHCNGMTNLGFGTHHSLAHQITRLCIDRGGGAWLWQLSMVRYLS